MGTECPTKGWHLFLFRTAQRCLHPASADWLVIGYKLKQRNNLDDRYSLPQKGYEFLKVDAAFAQTRSIF